MKTSFANITVKTPLRIADFVRNQPEELTYWKHSLTLETVAMIGEYQDVLSRVVCWHKDNDGLQLPPASLYLADITLC